MEKVVITEDKVKEVLESVLLENMKRVPRQDFNRAQFRIEELQNSLDEALKDFIKLQNSIPEGLRGSVNHKLLSIGTSLTNAQMEVVRLKNGVKGYKKKMYSRPPKPQDPQTPGV
jgi:hypothetical protein